MQLSHFGSLKLCGPCVDATDMRSHFSDRQRKLAGLALEGFDLGDFAIRTGAEFADLAGRHENARLQRTDGGVEMAGRGVEMML